MVLKVNLSILPGSLIACLSPLLVVIAFAACRSGSAPPEAEKQTILFPPASACRYPLSAPGKLFYRLGGGNWSAADTNADQPRYECVGSTPVVQLSADNNGSILVEYSATGVRDGALMVKLTYSADANVAHETTYRNTFANLCEVISKTALEATLPDLFRKKINNLESYTRPGKDSTETFDAGGGFVLLDRGRDLKNGKITVTVKFYSDIAFKLQP